MKDEKTVRGLTEESEGCRGKVKGGIVSRADRSREGMKNKG